MRRVDTERDTYFPKFFCILFIATVVVYQMYFSPDRIYALSSDAYTQMIMEIQGILNVIRDGSFPMWSFYKGLGQQITTGNPTYLGDPFAVIPVLLLQDNFIYALGYAAALKVILSGVLFYFYLKELRIAPYTRCIFALIYAFNGHMVCRGMWLHYATEVVFVALWLLALERHYHGKKRLFPIAFALLLVARSASYVYIYSLLTFFYIMMRTFFDEGWNLRKVVCSIFKMTPYYLMGLGISAIFVLPGMLNILASTRLGNVEPNYLSLGSLKLCVSAFVKLFSNAILGYDVPTSYTDILGDPATYSGILTVLLVPQLFSFKNIKSREKWALICCLSLIAVYYLCPPFVYFCNAFASKHIKISSFWQNVVLIITGTWILSKMEHSEEQLNKKLLILTGLLYIFLLLWINSFFKELLLGYFLICAILCILVYCVLGLSRIPNSMKIQLLVALCALEAFWGANTIISNASFIRGQDISTYQQLYEDTSCTDALNLIEDDSFFRVADNFHGSQNWSQYYGYYGAESYVSVPPSQQKAIYDLFEVKYHQSAFLDYVFQDMPLTNLSTTKYYLHDISKVSSIPEGFELYLRCGNIEIYENKNALPLGVIYYNAISEETFSEMTSLERSMVYTQAVVLEDADGKCEMANSHDISIQFGESYNLTESKPFTQEYMKYTSTSNDPMIFMDLIKEDDSKDNLYEISLHITSNVDTRAQIFYWENGSEVSADYVESFSVHKGKAEYRVILRGDIDHLRLDVGECIGSFLVKDLRVQGYQDMTDENARYLQDTAMDITSFSHNRITGKVNLDKEGYLFLSILSADGWKLTANGAEQEIVPAYGGFSACKLPAGEYEIELSYVTPGLLLGAAITFVSLLTFIGYIYSEKRKTENG